MSFAVKSKKSKKISRFVCSFFGRISGAPICLRFYLTFTVSGKTEFEECLLESGFLLTKDICLPSNYKTIAVVNKVVKPIVRLSSLIELNKKFTSLSAIFDIYFIWKDDNLIANASSSNAVFFFN